MHPLLRSFRLHGLLLLGVFIFGSSRLFPAHAGRTQPGPTSASPKVTSQGAPPGAQEVPTPQIPPPPAPLSPKQRKGLLKSNFEKMKRDVEELAALAKSLQEDINGSNENVLSLKIVDKAEKIERLAKKIKAAAKGY